MPDNKKAVHLDSMIDRYADDKDRDVRAAQKAKNYNADTWFSTYGGNPGPKQGVAHGNQSQQVQTGSVPKEETFVSPAQPPVSLNEDDDDIPDSAYDRVTAVSLDENGIPQEVELTESEMEELEDEYHDYHDQMPDSNNADAVTPYTPASIPVHTTDYSKLDALEKSVKASVTGSVVADDPNPHDKTESDKNPIDIAKISIEAAKKQKGGKPKVPKKQMSAKDDKGEKTMRVSYLKKFPSSVVDRIMAEMSYHDNMVDAVVAWIICHASEDFISAVAPDLNEKQLYLIEQWSGDTNVSVDRKLELLNKNAADIKYALDAVLLATSYIVVDRQGDFSESRNPDNFVSDKTINMMKTINGATRHARYKIGLDEGRPKR